MKHFTAILAVIMIAITSMAFDTVKEHADAYAAVCEMTDDISDITVTEVAEHVEEVSEKLYSDKEITLLALITIAEAEDEPEYGKRLVIDTVLNRVDNEHFPDDIHDVIYQKGQFSPMWNGRAKRCIELIDKETIDLVKEELEDRSDYDVIFFRESRYSDWGEPLFKVGGHYFSSYKED